MKASSPLTLPLHGPVMMLAVVVFVALLVAPFIGRTTSAVADCGGPSIRYTPAEVAVGDLILVEGYGWGDNCYDTGPPPAGEGGLGNALTDIDIVFVADDVEVLVASGNADGRYQFEVEIAVPSGLDQRQFTIETRPESYVETPQPMTIGDTAEVIAGNVEPEVISFGPEEQAIPEEALQNANGSASEGAAGGGLPATAIVMLVGIVAILLATGAVVATRRR